MSLPNQIGAVPEEFHSTLGVAGIEIIIGELSDNVIVRQEAQNILGLLSGNVWSSPIVTTSGAITLNYSFPTDSADYGTGNGFGQGQYPNPAPFNGLTQLSPDQLQPPALGQQSVAGYAFRLLESYVNVNFTPIDETPSQHAAIRLADSSYPTTSYAFVPTWSTHDRETPFLGTVCLRPRFRENTASPPFSMK